MSSPNIFFTGATGNHILFKTELGSISTGYLGGSILSRLLTIVDSSTITALVRSTEKADKLRPLGINTLIGSYTDFDVLTDAASKADVIFACVSI